MTKASTSTTGDVKDDKGEEKESINTVPFYKLFAFADSTDYVLMLLGTIGAIGNGLCMPIMTVLFGDVINSFGENQNSHHVVAVVSKVSLQIVYLGVGCAVVAFFQVAMWMITGERQATRIRNIYLKIILRQDISFFDKETNTGEVVGRMSGDMVLIQDAMGEKVGKFTQLLATFIGAFVIAFAKGWLLALVMMSTIPPLVISGGIMSVTIAKMASQGHTAYGKAAIVVEQTFSSIRTVASFTGEKKAISDYNNSLVEAYNSSVHEGLAIGLCFGTMKLFIYCTYSLAVWFGAKMILEKGYTGGTVLTVMFSMLTGSMSLGQASTCFSAFSAGRAAAYQMFETINRRPEIDSYDPKGKVLSDIRGDIELKDVYFTYPTRPNDEIFSGFSLYIPGGSTTALVGQSGSGKSTVISLIERFYDPRAGEILIDNINLKEFKLKWIREKIGLVSQEPVLFTSSIKDNIMYGKDNASMDEIRVAVELANAVRFIDKLPQGLDTMVGEHGTQLSGGQKQRIAIARAIIKDPRILLLDEATSALDTESETVVQEALDEIMVNRTTVIVAHRLSTIRNADMIAVIHRGKMVEKGSHSELLQNPEGAYSQLIKLQEVNDVHKEQDNLEIGTNPRRLSSPKSVDRQPISRGSSGSRRLSTSMSLSPMSFSLHEHVDVSTSAVDMEDDKTSKSHPKVPLRRLAYLNKPEIPIIIMGSIAAIINGALLPLFSIMLSSMIKTFYEPPHKMMSGARLWALMCVLFGLVSLLATPGRAYCFAIAGAKLIKRIRSLCFEKVINMEVSWFDNTENTSGAIGARLSTDAANFRALVGDALAEHVQDASSVATGLVIAFSSCWQLALIILILIPLLSVNGYVQMKFLKGFSVDAKMMYEEASHVANDAIRSIRTVASFCSEEKVMKLYRIKCEGPKKLGLKQGLISGIGFGVSFFLLFCMYGTSFYIGARFVEAGLTTFKDVFRVFFALSFAALIVSQSSSLTPDSSKAKTSAVSVFSILDRNSEIDPSDESGEKLESIKGEIKIRHVSFKYPTRPDVQIFRDLCLTIRSGKTLALVGKSGSGKSTIIQLLQRFYNPDSGSIKLDGVELHNFQLKWLRMQMGLVGQEPVLFNETVRANIAYGKYGDSTESEIIAASKLANAHKFISALHKGYDTMVGEKGVQMSGGQKQRIAIARAIVKSPTILLLDEATSALDVESESVVQEALDKVMVNRTTVVVAHRLSTIKNADVIAVVKNGVIVEKGKHENLINIEDGVYASLVSLYMSSNH